MIFLEPWVCLTSCPRIVEAVFDNNSRKPVIGICGHSICLSCVVRRPDRPCPVCKMGNAFIHRTINYGAVKIIEEFTDNAFVLFRNWWRDYLSVEGPCSKCLCQKPLRVCITCRRNQNIRQADLSRLILCDQCALEEMKSKGHRCEKLDNYMNLENVPQKCWKCWRKATDPQICIECLDSRTGAVNVEKFAFCAGCVIDYHDGHEVLKMADLQDQIKKHIFVTSARAKEILEHKLKSLKGEMKCKLRFMMMEETINVLITMTRRQIQARAINASDEEQNKNLESIEELMKSLEVQFNRYEKITNICRCVQIPDRDSDVFDYFSLMINNIDPQRVEDGCPYDFETSKAARQSLRIITGKEDIFELPGFKLFYSLPITPSYNTMYLGFPISTSIRYNCPAHSIQHHAAKTIGKIERTESF